MVKGGRAAVAVILTAVLATLLAPSAGAATSQQIYRDLADNGRLDQRYTQGELKKAFNSAVLQGYGQPGAQNELPAQVATAGQSEGVLPFTGLDLVLIVGFGVTMLLVGTGLRRIRVAPDSRA